MWTNRMQRSPRRWPGTVRASATLASLLMVTAMVAELAEAAGGLVTKRSQNSVTETMNRLERAVTERDLVVIARVDHAGAAQKAGMVLRPTQLLIFGNPKAGTPLMQSAQSVGIDLPLKALAWEDETGQVWIAYNDPAWLAARHDVKDRAELVKAMTTALEALTDAAAKGTR